MKDKKGFTLIEIIVVVTMLIVIIAGVIGAMTSVFRAQTAANLSNKVMKNGNLAMNEIKKDIINASSTGMSCPEGIGTSSVTFNNIIDGDVTTLICTDNKIASQSARETVDLISTNEVSVIDCSNFVKCVYSSGIPTSVEFSFTLSSGTTEPNYVEKNFNSTVSIRN
jgi:type II secretory pathway pseudopilin PulG